MTDEWKEIYLGEIIKIKHGYAFKGEYFSDEGEYIVLTPGNFFEEGGFKLRETKNKFYSSEYPKEYLLSKEDLIIAMTEQGDGLLGSSALIPDDNKFLHNQRLGLVQIKDDEKIDKIYLYYLFNTSILRNQIFASATGLKVRHTAPERVYKCRVNIPPLPIQKKIAAILSAYDDLIENNLKQIRLLEEMAQITYQEWFVWLKFPNHENTPIDEITGLPMSWALKSVGDLGEYLNGYAFKPDDLGENGLPVIKIKEMKSGVDSNTPRNFGYNIPYKYIVERGDIIFSWSASLEVVIWQYESGLLNQHLFKVTPNENISKVFLYLSLRNALPIFDNLTTGSTMKHIKRKELDFVEVNVPHPDLMNKFEEIVLPILTAVILLNHQNQRLKEVRDILLPRLMTGKITVDDL